MNNHIATELAAEILDCVERLDMIDDNMAVYMGKLQSIDERLSELELKFGTELSAPRTTTSAS